MKDSVSFGASTIDSEGFSVAEVGSNGGFTGTGDLTEPCISAMDGCGETCFFSLMTGPSATFAAKKMASY